MARTNPHAYIGGSRRTGSHGGYHRKLKTNSEGPKPSRIIGVCPELLALIAKYRRGKRRRPTDAHEAHQTGDVEQ